MNTVLALVVAVAVAVVAVMALLLVVRMQRRSNRIGLDLHQRLHQMALDRVEREPFAQVVLDQLTEYRERMEEIAGRSREP